MCFGPCGSRRKHGVGGSRVGDGVGVLKCSSRLQVLRESGGVDLC